MRLKTLLLSGAVALSTQINAQSWVVDSVTMGPNYGDDIFYSLQNGVTGTSANSNWHLAFQMTPQGPYGNVSIFANHVQTGVKIYPLHLRATTHFATLSAADTVGKTGTTRELFNSDSSWNYGAFNRMQDVSNPFDYSWGIYNMTSHNVVGDSLYLVTVANLSGPQVYKVWVKQYTSSPADSVQWQVRFAKFDGSEDTTIKIYRKPGYTDRLFAYYDLTNKTVIDREPSRTAWDLLFTRYKEYIPGAPGVPYYNVMGVLSNFDVTVNEKKKAAPDDTIGYAGYSYSAKLNEIGSDWKTFDNTTMQWKFADSTYYFIKTKNTNEYWQLHFTNFGGQADGKVIFKKRFLGNALSVAGINSIFNTYQLVPNPAHNNASILLDAKEVSKNARLIVSDMSGRVVYSNVVNINTGLNAFNINTATIASGTYLVTLTNGSWKATERLLVQH